MPEPTSGDFSDLISALADAQIEFVIVGGIASILHGSAYQTSDLDVSYARDSPNLAKLSALLSALHARLRGAPPDLPFRPDPATLKAGLNFTFRTDKGDLDLLGELAGLGGYEAVLEASIPVELSGRGVRVLDLDGFDSREKSGGTPKGSSAASGARSTAGAESPGLGRLAPDRSVGHDFRKRQTARERRRHGVQDVE